MATLSELYKYLEEKKDDDVIDFNFPSSSFPMEEQEKALFELFAWWKIERVKKNNLGIDVDKAIAYFDERISSTKNQFLKYRYYYFLYFLSNNNKYAEKAVDALMICLKDLLPKEKYVYPHNIENTIAVLMNLSKRVKYHQNEVKELIWSILNSNYGHFTKLVILNNAQKYDFFKVDDAEKISHICKLLLPLTSKYWKERCCEIGLHYAVKLQAKGKPYMAFFKEALGDIEMSKLFDITSDSNNIALPHLNDGFLEKAMGYYKEAGAKEKFLDAQKKYVLNKRNLKYITIETSVETNKNVVEYFNQLNEKLMNAKFDDLMWNLVWPQNFLFPSHTLIREHIPEDVSKEYPFSDKIKDINGNTKDAGVDYKYRQLYGVWLLNIVNNHILSTILEAVNQKKLTYAKIKKWMIRSTCFSYPIDYTRNNGSVTSTWYQQIDYAINSLMKQYQRTIQGKSADWRIPIEVLSIRFEGFLRNIIKCLGGKTTLIDKGNTSEILLEGLLHEPCLLKVLEEEDIEFFEYVLTSKGRNIRNNVAHAFYIPQDYGILDATLVFLCVLRLAKLSFNEEN